MGGDAARATGLVAGCLLDAALGDPRRGHPVAGFGAVAGNAETWLWADSRLRGTAFWAVCVAPAVGLGLVAEHLVGRLRGNDRRRGAAMVVAVAASTWSVLGGRTLVREADALTALLDAGDLDGARERLTHLVGRDPTDLDEAEIVRAAVESVAENTSDAVVAPLVWGALFGLPGLLGYRAVNTLDAMVGHRSTRYARFGWASARLDDLANLVPARLTAALTAACAPLIGGRVRTTWLVAYRDGRQHPSPNSGYCEAAFAGALGRQLGGTNVYGSRTEHRPLLGVGARPERADLRRSARLSAGVGALAGVGCAVLVTMSATRRTGAGRCTGVGRCTRIAVGRA